jgi:hypothetical protein
LRERIESFLRRGGGASFEELALELFRYQHETVPAYRRICELRHIRAADVRDWREIPAAPVELFRESFVDPGERPHVFVSSGTTAGDEQRSRHALRSLDTYRLAALGHFEAMVLADTPGRMSVLVLAPLAASHPQSSLGQMFSWVVESCSNGSVCHAFEPDGTLTLERALAWLGEASRATAPVLVLAVSSALTALLTEARRRGLSFRLPADSRIVDTGGNKTYGAPGAHTRTYSARALLKAVWTYLHVPAYLCLNEYGMTEMLSQFYDDALATRVEGGLSPRAKVGPPWVRTTVLDPASLAPVASGERGLLMHVDLANWDAVAFLQTHDVGRAIGRGFEVLGRAPGADARGCSNVMREVAAGAAAEER